MKESRSVIGRHISPLLRPADAIFANADASAANQACIDGIEIRRSG